MSRRIKKLIYFNRQERQGLAIFIGFIAIINLFGHLKIHYFDKKNEVNIIKASMIETIDKDLTASDASQHGNNADRNKGHSHSIRSSEPKIEDRKNPNSNQSSASAHPMDEKTEPEDEKSSNKGIPLASVDPNVADLEVLTSLGLNKGQAATLLNYRNSGGTFKRVEDVKKIYTISEDDFQRIRPYLFFPKEPSSQKSKADDKSTTVSATLDVNSAKIEEWTHLKGIGDYYASKIINFREKLGGFYSIDQIMETYHLPKETIEENRKWLKINTPVSKIDLKNADFTTLISHPYIDKRQTKLLLKLQKKELVITKDLFLQIFTEEEWKRVAPYLKY